MLRQNDAVLERKSILLSVKNFSTVSYIKKKPPNWTKAYFSPKSERKTDWNESYYFFYLLKTRPVQVMIGSVKMINGKQDGTTIPFVQVQLQHRVNTLKCGGYFSFTLYIHSYIRGSLNKFPDIFRMGTFIDSTHMNSSPLQSNLLRLQCTCYTVQTTSGRPHGSPLVWACQWPLSQPLSSPQLSHNDSLWA